MMRSLSSQISINLANRRLSYNEGNRLIKAYPVGVGKPSTPTPTGRYSVVSKIVQPGGMLGTRWMGLSVSTGNYGIHGTNNPASIGGYVSNGCIRMHNQDVEELFPRVVIGTPVEIILGTGGTKPVNTPGNPQGGGVIHTVRSGESLWDIARKYGKSLDLIIQVNKISNPDVIFPGQQIIIP
ncbi:L,D-transpeptidase family protein [Pelotomaculum propionicicum]|uniref:L,D-transpeptidase family protein n=1 Tax=Pelotomaculum propionicicum TaxID=258475 RepID=UPI003B7A1BDB